MPARTVGSRTSGARRAREHIDGRAGHPPHIWPDADCTVGVCYRPPLPYHIRYSVSPWLGEGKGERPGVKHMYVFLPNEAPLVEIDIRRIFFGKKVQTITFSAEGFLEKVHIEKDAELVALSKLPVAIIGAIGTALQFRADVLQIQTNEATDLKGLIEARRELSRQRSLLEAALVQAQAQQNRASSVSLLPPAPAASSSGEPQVAGSVLRNEK